MLASAEAAGPHVLRLPAMLLHPSTRLLSHNHRRRLAQTTQCSKTAHRRHQTTKPSQLRLTPPRLRRGTPRRPPDRQSHLRAAIRRRLPDISRLLRPATQHLRPDIRNNLRRAIRRHPPPTKPLHRVTQATPASRPATNHRHRGAIRRQRRDTLFSRLRRPCLNSRRRSGPRPLAG